MGNRMNFCGIVTFNETGSISKTNMNRIMSIKHYDEPTILSYSRDHQIELIETNQDSLIYYEIIINRETEIGEMTERNTHNSNNFLNSNLFTSNLEKENVGAALLSKINSFLGNNISKSLLKYNN